MASTQGLKINNSRKVDEVSSAVSLLPSGWHQNSEQKQSGAEVLYVIHKGKVRFWLQAGMAENLPDALQ